MLLEGQKWIQMDYGSVLVSALFLNKLTLSFSVSRLEEREAELKKEYNALHSRHTEVGNEGCSLVGSCTQGTFCCFLLYQLFFWPGKNPGQMGRIRFYINPLPPFAQIMRIQG